MSDLLKVRKLLNELGVECYTETVDGNILLHLEGPKVTKSNGEAEFVFTPEGEFSELYLYEA